MPRWLDRMRSARADSTLDDLVRGAADGDPRASELEEAFTLLLEVGRALLCLGLPAQRLEEALERLAKALGFELDGYSTPTALIVSIGEGSRWLTRVVRAEPGETDLERLGALQGIVGRVERRELSAADATRRVVRIVARPPRYGPWVILLAYALASTATATLLGGALPDLAVAAGLGVLVGALRSGASRVPSAGRIAPTFAALLASFLAKASGQWLPVQESVLVLSAIIVLLPGYTLTVATMELATANLVAGTSRLVGGLATLVQLGFGAALGHQLARVLPTVAHADPPTPTPQAWAFGAYGAAALAFALLLRAAPRDLPAILASAITAVLGARLGREWLGPELGALVGATFVALVSHLYARRFDRPALLLLTPGILLLVPGSVGFLSVSSMLEADVGAAMQLAFRMILIATSLAAGVLVATVAVPPRRAL
ncbi:MAG: threonine/serine exporter family protein [Sandaracinaceae bacterium]|nr:threonine/serine exporter family protein [Sandaracinaceae bacterium]